MNGSLNTVTVAIVASSSTPIGGSFLISCGDRSTEKVSVNSSSSDVKSVLSELLGSEEVLPSAIVNPTPSSAAYAVVVSGTNNTVTKPDAPLNAAQKAAQQRKVRSEARAKLSAVKSIQSCVRSKLTASSEGSAENYI